MNSTKKEISIHFKKGDQEAEMTFSDIDPEYQIALIDGIFKFFDLDVNFKELAEVHIKTRKAYQEFYEKTKVTSFTETNEQDTELPAEEADKGFEEVKKGFEEVAASGYNWQNPTAEPAPDHYATGIKEKHGKYYYRCRYKCPTCSKLANHYVLATDSQVACFDCKTKMHIHTATGSPLARDSQGNFFIAGDFHPVREN